MQKIWKRLLHGIVPWSSNFLDWCLVGPGTVLFILHQFYTNYVIYIYSWGWGWNGVFSWLVFLVLRKTFFLWLITDCSRTIIQGDGFGKFAFKKWYCSRPKGVKSWKWNVKTHQRLVVSNQKCGKTHGYTWLHHSKVPSSPQKFNPGATCHVLLFNRDALPSFAFIFFGVFTNFFFEILKNVR